MTSSPILDKMNAQQDKDQAMHQSSGIIPFQKSDKWLTFEEIEGVPMKSPSSLWSLLEVLKKCFWSHQEWL